MEWGDTGSAYRHKVGYAGTCRQVCNHRGEAGKLRRNRPSGFGRVRVRVDDHDRYYCRWVGRR